MIRNLLSKFNFSRSTRTNLQSPYRCLFIKQPSNFFQKSTSSLFHQKNAYCFAEVKKSHLINPYNKQLVSDKQYTSDEMIEQRITIITQQQKLWKSVPLETRVELVQNLINQILKDEQYLMPIITDSIGKSYKDIRREFKQIKEELPFLLDSGRETLKQFKISQKRQAGIIKVIQQPVGLAFIFPHYSEPIFDSIIHLVPCLISGCGALIKASDYNHFLGPYLEKKAKEILKYDLIGDLFIEPQDLPKLSEFSSVKKIVYSGSHSSAKHIFEVMAEKRFVDCNMFFGGQDAAYIDETANTEQAVKQIVKIAFANNGQSYDSIKRVYIKQPQFEDVVNKLKVQILKLKLGNPKDQATTNGPLAIPDSATKMQELVKQAIQLGANCEIGGMITSDEGGVGIFFEPTLLTNVGTDMPILQTQTPAPILCCISVQNSKQFVASINDHRYGAGVKIFTKQTSNEQIYERYKNVINELEVGKIVFNKGSLFTANRRSESWRVSSLNRKLSANCFEQYTISKVFDINN